MKKLYIAANKEYVQRTFQRRVIAGVEYQVYPVVMLVEGVHHGVGTDPVYYSPDVIRNSAAAWNNVPVTVGHPVTTDGQHILCNHDGTILACWQVGHIANARFEDGKLKADVWLNTAWTNQHAPNLLQFIENGGQLEVSTGLLALDDGQAGSWSNEEFAASIVDMLPDHLALLPNSTGACSWNDGCGIRANAAKEEKEQYQLVVQEQELGQVIEKINAHVNGLDVYDQARERYAEINFLRAVYQSYFVYENKIRRQNQPEVRTMYKQEYSVDSDGNLVMPSGPVEVIEEIKYKPKANEGQIANNTNTKEVQTMAKGTEKPCCEARINALIANTKNAFTEDDREWLTSLNEGQISKLEVNAEPEPAASTAAAPVVNKAETLQTYLAGAPLEIRAVLNAGLRELDSKRAGLIARITSNERSKFTEASLKDMDLAMLESIASLLPEPAQPNYSFQNPAAVTNQDAGEEPYVPMTLGEALTAKK